MDCQECNEFVEAIQRQYDYLFQRYGFRLFACESTKEGEYCLVVLQSPECRIRFVHEQGLPFGHFGTVHSPVQWEDFVGESQVWFSMKVLLAYLELRDWHELQDEAVPPSGAERTTASILAEDAPRLRVYMDELVAAFGPHRSREWWRAYDAFIQEQIRSLDL